VFSSSRCLPAFKAAQASSKERGAVGVRDTPQLDAGIGEQGFESS